MTALLLFGSIAFAENSLELKQIEATKSSIKARFLDAGVNHKYRILYRVHSENASAEYFDLGTYSYDPMVRVLSKGKIFIENLYPGTRYDLRLEVINTKTKNSYYTNPIVVVTAPSTGNLSIKQTKATETSASFIVSGAGGITNLYEMQFYPENDKKSAIPKTFESKEDEFENEFTLDGLKPDTKYKVEITPCFRANFIDPSVTDPKQSFVAHGKTKVFNLDLVPSKPVDDLHISESGENFFTVTWATNKLADGYQVSVLDKETGVISGPEDINTNSKTISFMNCGTYSVVVRLFITINNEHFYGPISKLTLSGLSPNHTWDNGVVQKESTYDEEGICLYTCTHCSATKTEPIDKKIYTEKVNIKGIKTSKGTITISWKKASKAKGYFIYRKDPGSNQFKAVGKITNSNTLKWTDSKGLKKGKSYSYKVRAYIVSNNKKFLSKNYSKTKSIVVK